MAFAKRTIDFSPFHIAHGVVFVGHGLTSDFRLLGVVIPHEQVRDTDKHIAKARQLFVEQLEFLDKEKYADGERVSGVRRALA